MLGLAKIFMVGTSCPSQITGGDIVVIKLKLIPLGKKEILFLQLLYRFLRIVTKLQGTWCLAD